MSTTETTSPFLSAEDHVTVGTHLRWHRRTYKVTRLCRESIHLVNVKTGKYHTLFLTDSAEPLGEISYCSVGELVMAVAVEADARTNRVTS